MPILNWMGEHPFLTFVLVLIVAEFLIEFTKALRGKDP